MKKFVAFSLVTLLFLSGCGNQPTVPTDNLPTPSQAVNSVTESGNEPYFPKDTITGKAPKVPTEEPLATPESKPIEMKTTPVPQAKTGTDTPQEPQHEVETDWPSANTEESPILPVQEEMPPQTQPELPESRPEPEQTIVHPTSPEVPSEPEEQEPAESIDYRIAF